MDIPLLFSTQCKAMCSLMVYVFAATILTVVGGFYDKEDSGLETTEKALIRCNLNSEATDDESDIDCSVNLYDDTTSTNTTVKPSIPRVTVIPHGPFYDFVVNICQALLHRFLVERVPRYFNMLGKSLHGLGSGMFMKMMLKRFARRLMKISVFRGELLRIKVQHFLTMISSGKPMVNEFFFAMNAIYSVRDDNKMDDFVYLLKQYGLAKRKHIGERTRWTFERIIFDVFYKQTESIQTDIKIKFQSAYIEYIEEHKNSL